MRYTHVLLLACLIIPLGCFPDNDVEDKRAVQDAINRLKQFVEEEIVQDGTVDCNTGLPSSLSESSVRLVWSGAVVDANKIVCDYQSDIHLEQTLRVQVTQGDVSSTLDIVINLTPDEDDHYFSCEAWRVIYDGVDFENSNTAWFRDEDNKRHYYLCTADHVANIALGTDSADDVYHLMDDIDLMQEAFDNDEGNGNWKPIAPWDAGDPESFFKGTLDGHGHRISGVVIDQPETSIVGFFGCIKDATIKNLGVSAVVYGQDSTGGLVGLSNQSTIGSSYFMGSVYGTVGVGGLIGEAHDITISSSYATGTVMNDNTSSYVGGLMGYGSEGMITSSYATSSVLGGEYTGGLIGYGEFIAISASYATGSVSGTVPVGGLVGGAYFSAIAVSYATGRVNGNSSLGGLVGLIDEVDVALNYYDQTTTGQEDSVGGVGFATEDMLDQSFTFTGFPNDLWIHDLSSSYKYPYFSRQTSIELAALALDFVAIKNSNTAPNNIQSDLDFPTSWNGFDVSWSSSNTDIINTDGTVNAPGSSTQIIITATLSDPEQVLRTMIRSFIFDAVPVPSP